MMKTVGAYEAKTHLSRLLERVARGERITITKHGTPVAVLYPPEVIRKFPPKQIISEIKKFRHKKRLNGISLKEVIKEGRR